MLLGIDTGGTYTDAVLFTEEEGVLKTSKSLTTKHDLSLGITRAVDAILEDSKGKTIRMVSLSTTLATNAMVEAHGSPVCLVLIGFKENALQRSKLGEAIGQNPCVFIEGGHNSIGDEQQVLDMAAVEAAVAEHAPGVSAFAISSMFSVRNPEHEKRVRAYILEKTGQPVTCAHELSSGLDAPRRALTAVLNARLISQIHQLIAAVKKMLDTKGIKAPLMVVKGDGSLITADTAIRRPVETILSGPAASVVGARYLSGEQDVFVSDMGGTTTDIALLKNGRPVLDDNGAMVGGWQTMVEAVAVHTYGLGGDSEVHLDRERIVKLGPRRAQPVSLLGHEYPEILKVLKSQEADERPREYDGRFAIRLRKLDTGAESLSKMEREIWDALENGPVALNRLLDKPSLARPLMRLVDRGLVIKSGLTPSCASHILGRHSSWNREAAEIAARLYIRAGVLNNIVSDMTATDLAARIYEQTVVQTGETLVDSALREMKLPAASPEEKLAEQVLLNGLRNRAEENAPPLLNVSIGLSRPIVGIGAPAATYYPDVAPRLNTRLVVPEHAEVTNAVGAVAGGVIQTLKALILSPEKGRYRVHIALGVKDFIDLEEAAKFATDQLSELVLQQARECGASNAEVTIERDDSIVEISGETTFIESRIIATAQGSPDQLP
ncbi:hydantoinase/oxoprolinase family protein [Kiloniella sp. b19]|uniref:hydantoinase/oxoprolinase family protein n=1 Tax=Kiloniella sp. GXU_MW_B19 TaxID=3141326 RepID=UPI0031DE3F0B